MKAGIIIPQGWTGEYAEWEPAHAWKRSVFVARQAEELGFESIWAFDHFHTTPDPTDEMTFESFTFLTALSQRTERVKLGHIVMSAGFRNPALVAKMISTLDLVSNGRAQVGIGAGWKQEEWEAYGYDFPGRKDRLDRLADSLEIIRAMLSPGRSTYEGTHASIHGAINEPPGLQEPRVPIMIGGNGPERTWRLAARYADELNIDAMLPQDLKAALPTIHSRCEEIGRDPDTLDVSVHIWWEQATEAGQARRERLAEYAELGIRRVQMLVRGSVDDDDALPAFAEDCRAAGVELG
ncbi:MAG: TIGR03560 family F420-dependent LLM class oxidoreductase [Chloroflexi bacterium]|nr:TIGR03560 family F420-dependent LLM class oxidoreductase [Chloroflexota bacterium]